MVSFRSLKSGQIAEAKQLIRSIRSGLTHAQFWTLPVSLIRLTTSLAPLVLRYLKSRRIMAMFDQGVDFLIQAEQLPTALSKIELVPGFYNKAGLCNVRVNWQLDGRELQSIRAFVRAAEVFFTRTGIGTLRPSELLKESDEALSKHLADTYHQCGGLRMGTDPEVSVTDADCKVWGSDNVYVGGASVFPSSGHANCTLTALALGIRLADHLEKRLRK